MLQTRDRLIKCFRMVFPKVSEDHVPRASLVETPTWDSLASVTLIAAIEGEFAMEIPLGDYEQMSSFESIYVYLKQREGS